MENKNFYFYVIKTADDKLYAGYSDDVSKRFATHSAKKGAKFLKPESRHPLKLIYRQEFSSKHDAMSAEAKFKRLTRIQKEAFLESNGQSENN